ncbi:MAG: excinuclease ABC subunit UvrA, partial [Mucinivorans sp.]
MERKINFQKMIKVEGARVHNLKNIDVQIPSQSLCVITGLSGSGKSSLAFDTIYAEGQRRYLETLSAYSRQFMGSLERPDVDKISGLSPVIAIEQKTSSRNPRSTVGTVTEINDFLRLLFARASIAYSKATGQAMVHYTDDQIIAKIFEHYSDKKIAILAPLIKGRKGHYRELFETLRSKGFIYARIDGKIVEMTHLLQLDRYKIHNIELVVDRLMVDIPSTERLAKSVSDSFRYGKGSIAVVELFADKTIEEDRQEL